MPNYATNTVVFLAEPERLHIIREAIDSDKFDFNRIRPTPEALAQLSSPVYIVEQSVIDQKVADGHSTAQYLTREENARLIAEFGANDWYGWRLSNWGTKWTGSSAEVLHDSPSAIVVRFDTAWNEPNELYAYLTQHHGVQVIGGAIYEDGNEFGLTYTIDQALVERLGVDGEAFARDVFDALFSVEEEVCVEEAGTEDEWTWTNRWIEFTGMVDGSAPAALSAGPNAPDRQDRGDHGRGLGLTIHEQGDQDHE